MNEQMPVKREWKDLVQDLKIAVHNTTVQLELLRAQLKEAEAHARGS